MVVDTMCTQDANVLKSVKAFSLAGLNIIFWSHLPSRVNTL